MNKYCRQCILRFTEKTNAKLKLDQNPDYVNEFNLLMETIDDYEEAKDFHTSLGYLIRRYTNTDDIFKKEKKEMNTMAGEIIANLHHDVRKAEDPLYEALRLAISGNIMDMAQGVERSVSSVKEMGHIYEWTSYKGFKEKLDSAKSIAVIGDNCGEVVFDSLLEHYLAEIKSQAKIVHFVRKEPMLNDCTMDDLDDLLLKTPVEYKPLLARTQNLKQVQSEFDIVLVKGQANFEMLWKEREANAFFLLVLKCELVAGILEGEVGQPTLAGGDSNGV